MLNVLPAAPRRRTVDGRQGPDRRFQERGRDHDLESGQPAHREQAGREGGDIGEVVRDRVFDALQAHFRPEFLNRIDDIILFTRSVGPTSARSSGSSFTQLAERLADRG